MQFRNKILNTYKFHVLVYLSYWAKSFKSKKIVISYKIIHFYVNSCGINKKYIPFINFFVNTQFNTIVCDIISYLTKKQTWFTPRKLTLALIAIDNVRRLGTPGSTYITYVWEVQRIKLPGVESSHKSAQKPSHLSQRILILRGIQ